jgi:pimeloyl-ACP methyl ester carboxylesterase
MTGITEGSVEANGLSFGYLAAGDHGPLALCLHGFPDSAWTWRHLLPELAAAGYRAVAPFLRGYAPTQVPEVGHYQVGILAQDANALHTALGGDEDAVLIGHDWGAMATWAAIHDQPRWRKAVAMAVPPPGAVAGGFFQYEQLRKSWYMFFFQHPLSDMAVAMNDLAFIDGLWADWSPGYDATEDLATTKAALRDPTNLAAALGYYRAILGGVNLSTDPAVAALEAAANGPVPVPALYLHGRTDGCMGAALAETARPLLTEKGSALEIVDDAGHFLQLEQPEVVNRLVLAFLA